MATPVDLMDTAISITVNLSGIPAAQVGFGTVMFAVLPGVGAWPGSAVTRSYSYGTHTTAIAADLTATYITAATAAKLNTAFAQNPHPSVIKIGKLTAGLAAVPADLAAILAEDDDWYGLVLGLDSTAIAGKETAAVAAAAFAASNKKVFVHHSEDVDLYDAGDSDDIASTEKALGHERSLIMFSQLVGAIPGTAEQAADLSVACRWLAFDPDVISAPARAQVTGVVAAALTATGVPLTTAQITAIKNKNGNVLQVYGSAAAFFDPGKNSNGRAIEEVLSGDWLEARIRSDIATQAVAMANRGEKWPLNNEGAAYLAAIVNGWLQRGVQARHFESFTPGASVINTTTKTISYAARAVYLDNALNFAVTVNFD